MQSILQVKKMVFSWVLCSKRLMSVVSLPMRQGKTWHSVEHPLFQSTLLCSAWVQPLPAQLLAPQNWKMSRLLRVGQQCLRGRV